jgi:hypothetical protein
VLVVGPVLYLAGHTLFRLRMIHNVSRKRVIAAAVIIALAPLGTVISSLALSFCVLAVLAVLAASETRNRLASA